MSLFRCVYIRLPFINLTLGKSRHSYTNLLCFVGLFSISLSLPLFFAIANMQFQKRPLLQLVSFFLFISKIFHFSHADVGTAAQYSPPYLPTACYSDDQTQFPTSNLFAAAGDGIWDNGASCGRQYLVRCISASRPGTCVPDQTIQVKIVDYAPTSQSPPSAQSTTIVLSETAFAGITNLPVDSINIEFQQV